MVGKREIEIGLVANFRIAVNRKLSGHRQRMADHKFGESQDFRVGVKRQAASNAEFGDTVGPSSMQAGPSDANRPRAVSPSLAKTSSAVKTVRFPHCENRETQDRNPTIVLKTCAPTPPHGPYIYVKDGSSTDVRTPPLDFQAARS